MPEGSPDAFEFSARTRVLYGAGVVQRVGECARELGGPSVLLVTDPGICRAGHTDRVEESLQQAGLEVTVFDSVHHNPTTKDVDACLAVARGAAPDLIVALGGGSSLDTAKGANFLLTNGGRMEDYWGEGKATRPMLPLLAVPTTAGTGSEMQSFALISRCEDHQKMACGDPRALPRVALLDPELTLTMPAAVTVVTGLDTVTHAVEAAVTRRRNAFSVMCAREAFQKAFLSLPRVIRTPDDLAARGEMLLASALAGLAIENSMLGAAHSLANPLTARHDVDHGQAVGMMLPHVVRFNSAEAEAAAGYARLARDVGLVAVDVDDRSSAQALAAELDGLLVTCSLPRTLEELAVPESAIPGLATEAASQWTARFNPRPVAAADLEGLYRDALSLASERGPHAPPRSC